jgi:hypothetical protein
MNKRKAVHSPFHRKLPKTAKEVVRELKRGGNRIRRAARPAVRG